MKTNRLIAEFVGTATLLIAVVGSSFMAQQLTQDKALALLINALVTAAILSIIIKTLINQSGAHFNPAVTIALILSGRFATRDLLPYVAAQILGAVSGALLANIMFSTEVFTTSMINRNGYQLLVGEAVATSGLVILALLTGKKLVWKLIPLWIFGAYFFTSSTSFANPAVTIARVFTSAPAGISPSSITLFILVQIGVALILGRLLRERK